MDRRRRATGATGAGPQGKIALAVLLVLIILAAVGFCGCWSIVYDRDGSFHLGLPWKTETPRGRGSARRDRRIIQGRRSRRLWLPSLLPPRR